MGTVIGKVSVETPKYNVTSSGEGYEIREYPPQLAAEVTYNPTTMKRGADGGFMVLAAYIGAVGKPANVAPKGESGEKIAMTAPVITQEGAGQKGEPEKIAMTAPVVTQESEAEGKNKLITMQFILPAQYKSVESTPKPTDERVVVKEIPGRKYGVTTFSGVADNSLVEKKLVGLKAALEKGGFTITGQHLVARYNPPWTPGFLRTNEVLLPVE
ncbi:unnamed protein product [Calypogeia fissa]